MRDTTFFLVISHFLAD